MEAVETTVADVVEADSASKAREVFEWLGNLGSNELKVSLTRIRPQSHRGFPCGGAIDKFEHAVTLEEIADLHGGGTFQIRVNVPNPKHGKVGAGKQAPFMFAGARTFTIAGLPKLDNLIGYEEQENQRSGAGGGSNHESSRAMDMATEMVKQANERAFRMEAQGRGGDEIVSALTESHDRRIESLTRLLSEKDKTIVDLLGKEPSTRNEDKLFELVGTKDDAHARQIASMQTDHASQLQAVRTSHEAEMRQVRDFSRNELERYQDRFDRQIDQMTRSHDRELGQTQSQHTQSLETIKLSYDTRIEALNTTIRRGEQELVNARNELIALRAKKELSPMEQIQGLVTLKNGFDSLMPAAAEPEEKESGIVRAIEAVANSELARGFAAKIMSGPPAAAAPPGEQMVQVRRRDGAVVQVPRSVIERAQAAKAAAREAAAQPGAPIILDPKEVQMALQFIEQAYKNGQPPEVLAASARNLVPAPILSYLKSEGVDHFLNKVAKIQDGSPLATVDGRMYVRKMAKFLLDGTTDMDETETEPEPADLDIEGEIGDDSGEAEDVPDEAAVPD